jgi:hypothetical protein
MAKAQKQKEKAEGSSNVSLFSRDNYLLMLAGLVSLALGFFLMSGGKSQDSKVFNPDEIYSQVRITAAPILIILGFLLEIFAIMKKPGSAEK